jgi:hypothetical protein
VVITHKMELYNLKTPKNKTKPEKNKENHYVDNELFCEEMTKWKQTIKEAESIGDDKPPITDYMGECFLKIAERLSYRPNFINYPFREEMVGDGIENCLMYCSNFDPNKSKNPFSYFTQIIYYAFLRRIQREKKQEYIKYRCFEIMDEHGVIPDDFKYQLANSKGDSSKNPYADMFRLSETDIDNFTKKPRKKTKKKTKKKTNNLDEVLQDDIKSEDSTD